MPSDKKAVAESLKLKPALDAEISKVYNSDASPDIDDTAFWEVWRLAERYYGINDCAAAGEGASEAQVEQQVNATAEIYEALPPDLFREEWGVQYQVGNWSTVVMYPSKGEAYWRLERAKANNIRARLIHIPAEDYTDAKA